MLKIIIKCVYPQNDPCSESPRGPLKASIKVVGLRENIFTPDTMFEQLIQTHTEVIKVHPDSVRALGRGHRGRRSGVLLVLRVGAVLVVFLQVASLGAETVKAVPGVAFVGGEEIPQV